MLALAIGALIGIERERHAKAKIYEKPKKGKRSRKKAVRRKTEIFAGFRTFMLISLLGLLTSHLTSIVINMTPIYIGISSIAVLAFMSYYLNFKKFGVIGMTTEIAFFLTYVIGIFLYFESAPFFLSISLGIILTLILFFREPLHKFAYGLTKKEIRDAIVFAALLFIIFPLLPTYPIGPFGSINLSLIWQSMLVVMFVSFAGYVAMKIFGYKLGIGIAGVFGGLASSTSVAVIMAEEAKKNKKVLNSALFTIVIASSTMFFRMIVVAMIFGYSVGITLMPSLMLLASVGYVLSYIPFEKTKKIKTRIKLDSPISFKPILQFVILFAVIGFATHIARIYTPSAMYFIAILSGLFDVDAINISLAAMSGAGLLPVKTAVLSLIMAALANTVAKAVLVRWIGGKKIGMEVAKMFLIIVLTGIASLVLAWLLL
jgi:uncharacterized membrane protein (DUF4010 family)